jgi:hemoglobin
MSNDTVFDRIGGPSAVSRLVLDFYEHVLRCDRLAPHFAEVDMRRLIEHQAKFMSAVMGGPSSYSDQDLRDIHAHLSIDDADFEAMMEIFAAAVANHIPHPADGAALIEAVRQRRDAVVGA